MPRPRPNRRYYRAPINNITVSENVCFEAVDSSTLRIPALFLLKGGHPPRDPQPQIARLGNQFQQYNRSVLYEMGIMGDLLYDGNSIEILFKTRTTIGAIPLISPTSGKPDYGLVIKPRFDWAGLGPMLAQMGWRIIPTPLALPSLPRSDRKIPPWVLLTIILFRIKDLLEKLERRFEICDDDRNAPHGSVKWPVYATARLPKCHFLKVPCIYPDLRDDRDLKGAIHFALKKHLASLSGQRSAGFAVLQLIALCHSLLEKVRNVAVHPNAKSFMLSEKANADGYISQRDTSN